LLFFTTWGITAQLKFTVFYGPISMKERCGAPLLGLAKSIYYIIIKNGYKYLGILEVDQVFHPKNWGARPTRNVCNCGHADSKWWETLIMMKYAYSDLILYFMHL